MRKILHHRIECVVELQKSIYGIYMYMHMHVHVPVAPVVMFRQVVTPIQN